MRKIKNYLIVSLLTIAFQSTFSVNAKTTVCNDKPNPFSERTTIEVTIPESTTNAALFIYDMNGKQVKQINITERGKTNVSITSEGLEPGMFLYSLIADGKIVSTKKMILTN